MLKGQRKRGQCSKVKEKEVKEKKSSMLKGYNANHKVQCSKFKVQSFSGRLSSLSMRRLGSL